MKKRRLALTVTVLTSLAVLAGCGEPVKKNEGVILTVTTESGVKEIKADDLFSEYKTSTDKISTYYDAIYEVYVRSLFADKASGLEVKLSEIKRDADIKVKGEIENAKSNKADNNTTFDAEMKKIYESYGVEDETGLKEHFIYELMKKEVREMYFDAEAAWTKTANDSNTWTDLKTRYLEEKLPYHVKHILVKLASTSSSIETATISSTEAIKLSGVVKRLAIQKNGETFSDIALEQSDDTGSKEASGNLGIMDKDTGYVNEFKLGVYAYDAIYNQTSVLSDETKALLVSEDAEAKLADVSDENFGLGEIPYDVALNIEKQANKVLSTDGVSINDGNAIYYPRNIYFNQFFNKHNVSVITPANMDGTANATYEALAGFQAVEELGGKQVLTDEKGNVILVVKAGGTALGGSYEGVHFIAIERSALVQDVNGVSLSDYYTTSIPGDNDYPVAEGKNKPTYVNYMATERTTYQTRANEVESKIQGFDSLLDYRIFNQLLDSNQIKILDEQLATFLDSYVNTKFLTAQWDDEEAFVKTWKEWLDILEVQAHQRATRLVEHKCASAFLNYDNDDNDKKLFEEGGACYVK